MATHDHHDDFGGLQRDLLATGAAMDRRGLLRYRRALRRRSRRASAARLRGRARPRPSDHYGNATVTTGTTGEHVQPDSRGDAGPFPGDGSNGPNVLNATRRRPQRHPSSFAGLSAARPTACRSTIVLTIVSASTCAPLAGRAVYLWHCDRLGRYSLYSSGRDEPELPARHAGGRRERKVTFHVDLPGLLRGPLAAHPLRGVSQPCRRRRAWRTRSPRRRSRCRRRVRSGLRDGRLRGERHEPVAGHRSPPTASSATGPRSSSRR